MSADPPRMPGPPRSAPTAALTRPWAYGLSLATTLATLGARLAFASWFGSRPALVLFVLPIFLSAHLGGLGPGLLSTALFALGSAYFLMPPVRSFAMENSVDTVLWLILVLIGVLISVLTESLHVARQSEHALITPEQSLVTERKVQSGFGLALVFLLVIGGVSVFSVVKLRESAGWATHTEEVISSLRLLFSSVTDAETAERGFIITGTVSYLEPKDEAQRVIKEQLLGLRALTADNRGQQHQLNELEPLIARRLAAAERNVALRRRQILTSAQASEVIGEEKSIHDRIRELIAQMEATEQGLLREREARAKKMDEITRVVIIFGGSLGFVSVALALFVMNREFAVRRRAEHALREARDQLEVRVRDRTAELERSNEALGRGERRFRALIENSGDSIALIDANNRILYLSPSVAAVEGYAPEELIGRNGLENTHPDDLGLIQEKVQELAAHPGRPVPVLWRRRHKNGNWLWLEGVATNLLDDPAVGAIVTNYRDVTERLNAAKALRESEELFSRAFRLSPDFLIIVRLRDRTVVRANEAICRLWARTPEEMIGQPVNDYIKWPSEDERLAFMQALHENGECLKYETNFRLKDERPVRFIVSSRMITLNGDPCILSVMSDITDRKKAEAAAAQLAAIVAYSEDAIIGKDLNGAVTSWNAAAERIYGYTAEEMMGQPILRLIPPERHHEESKIISRLRQGESVRSFETVGLRKDGRTFEVSITASAIKDERGAVIGASKIVRDITQRKRTEERAVWLASFPERNPNPIVEIDLAAGVFHYVNVAAGRQFPDLEIQGLRHPLVAGLEALATQLAENGTQRREIAVGQHFVSQMLIHVGGARLRVYSTDITERRRAEEALERSRAEFKDLFDNAPAGYHEVDSEGRLTRINQTELNMLGYTAGELLGQYVWKVSATQEVSRRAVGEKLRGVVPLQAFERRLQRKDGTSFPVLIEDKLVKSKDGEITGIRSVIRDITERKELEEALRENEKRFRTMANSIPQLAWIARSDGFITWYNERWYQYTGTNPAQMEGWGWQRVHHPEFLPKVMEGWTAAIDSGQPFEMEFPLRGADGEFRAFLTRVQPLKDSEGRVVQWFGTNTDVEALRQAGEALRQSEQKMREVIDGLGPNTFLGLMTPDGILIEANRPGLAAAGLRAEEVLGKPFDQTFWWGYSEKVREELRHAMARGAAGEASRYDVQVRVAGDNLVWIDFSLTPVRDADGRVIYLVPSGNVIDERVRAEAAIQRLNAELERRVIERTAQLESANKELEAFSYSVSHDLRAPLRAVDGFSQAVLEDFGPLLPPEGLHHLRTIRESAQRMGELIDDLLTFSRLSRQTLRRQTVEIEKMVQMVGQELRHGSNGREIEFKLGALPSCQGDSALVRQVWVNLVSNALKYTSKRDRALIEIGSNRQGAETVYFIRDNGTGFDMRYAHKLFGVFQRLHRAEDYEGTGVGLAIVQRVVHRHGGRIWAEAAVDKGATFFFTLEGEIKT